MTTYGFMAGCALSSSNPQRIKDTIAYLKPYYPDLVEIQSCCGRPTRMIGREDVFQQKFGHLTDLVNGAGIDNLIVACQGCLKTMRDEDRFKTTSLWVKMAELGLPEACLNKAKDSDVTFSIQDSCPTREMTEIHEAVRFLLKSLGYDVAKSRLSGKNTFCCGMGGMCGVSNQTLSHEVAHQRVTSFKTDYIATYCATCTFAMGVGGGLAWHLLDLIFGPVVNLGDQPAKHPLGNPVKSWSNRYKSKRIIQKA